MWLLKCCKFNVGLCNVVSIMWLWLWDDLYKSTPISTMVLLVTRVLPLLMGEKGRESCHFSGSFLGLGAYFSKSISETADLNTI